MTYPQYTTKKRAKFNSISGPVNLPSNTICDARHETLNNVPGVYIFHNDMPLCRVGSQNAKDYFLGYDPVNPKPEIERQKLALELFNSAPKDTGDELADPSNPWREYGELVAFAGAYKWEWDSKIYDLPTHKLQFLLNCIKKGEKPYCIGLSTQQPATR